MTRDAAIFSPWIVKKHVGKRYGLPTELTDATRSEIAQIKKREMEKRKRDRDERLGISHSEYDDTAAEDAANKKRRGKAEAALERIKDKEERERERERLKREREEEEERRKRKALKYPAEGELFCDRSNARPTG